MRTLSAALNLLYRRFRVKKKTSKFSPRRPFYALLGARTGSRNYRVRLCDSDGNIPYRGVGTVAFHSRVTLEVGTVYDRNGDAVMRPSAMLADTRAAAAAAPPEDKGDGKGADGAGTVEKCIDCAHDLHPGQPCEDSECRCDLTPRTEGTAPPAAPAAATDTRGGGSPDDADVNA